MAIPMENFADPSHIFIFPPDPPATFYFLSEYFTPPSNILFDPLRLFFSPPEYFSGFC